MTISEKTTSARNDYVGNGVKTQFNFTFEVLNETNSSKNYSLKVLLTENNIETEQVEDTDYTVTYNSETKLGLITFSTAPTSSQTITLLSDISFSQSTDYINIGTDKFPADSHEGTVDKLTLISRQLDESIGRAILLPESSELSNITIPVSTANANKAIVVNNDGDNLTAKNLADIGTAPVTDFIKTLLDDETASEARTTLDAQQLNVNLTSLAGLTGSADKLPYFTGAGTLALQDRLATATNRGVTYIYKPITIANNSTDSDHDIDLGAGNATLSDGSGQVATTAQTKQIDATWVAGTGNGGLAEGLTVANDTTYYIHTLADNDNNFVGYGFDTSETASNLLADTNVIAAGGTKYCREIYHVITDGSANIRNGNYTVFQGGYRFIYNNNITAFSTAAPAANTDLPINCPPLTYPLLSGYMNHSGAYSIYAINSKIEGDDVICGVIGNVTSARSSITPPQLILADSNSLIQHGYILASGPSTIILYLNGWTEKF